MSPSICGFAICGLSKKVCLPSSDIFMFWLLEIHCTCTVVHLTACFLILQYSTVKKHGCFRGKNGSHYDAASVLTNSRKPFRKQISNFTWLNNKVLEIWETGIIWHGFSICSVSQLQYIKKDMNSWGSGTTRAWCLTCSGRRSSSASGLTVRMLRTPHPSSQKKFCKYNKYFKKATLLYHTG
jgi:hypothetical protein